METLLLTRLAESKANRSGLVNSDPGNSSQLTRRGRRQARSSGRSLQDHEIDLCVTSQLRRAVETADIALRGRDVPREVRGDFNDPRAGRFEGGRVGRYDAWVRQMGLRASNPGGGESQLEALARYVRGYRLLLGRPERAILVVTHALPMSWLIGGGEIGIDIGNPRIDFTDLFHHLGQGEVGEAIASLESFLAKQKLA